MRVLRTRKTVWTEFKRQLKMAIIAAIGFTIAYVWKETIFQIMENASINLGNLLGIGYSPLYVPLLTTVLGVLLIFLFSKLLKGG